MAISETKYACVHGRVHGRVRAVSDRVDGRVRAVYRDAGRVEPLVFFLLTMVPKLS